MTDYQYQNLVLKGGGVSAMAYIGALEVLQQKGILSKIKKMAGSSAGSAIACLLAIGYSPKELKQLVINLDVTQFQDGRLGYLGDCYRFWSSFGIYNGDQLLHWFQKVIYAKTKNENITFQNIYDKYDIDLVITGTCLNKRTTYYFQKSSNPTMPVAIALRISNGMPLLFRPMIWKKDILVDGGLLNNFPIWIFDREYNSKKERVVHDKKIKLNKQTLGLKLLAGKERADDVVFHGHDDIKYLTDFIVCLMNTMATQIDRMYITDQYWKQTVAISSGHIISTSFNIKRTEKEMLIQNGRRATLLFLANRKKEIAKEKIKERNKELLKFL